MATLQPVRYGKVVGRLVNIIADGPDEDEFPISGGYPDAVPMTGRVTFTARASRVLVTGAEPSPVTVFSAPITAQLDENGYLTHNGKRGVFLLAPSVETNPPEWTYTVKYDLQDYEGNAVTHIFDMEIVEYEPGPNPADPDAGSTAVDLTVVTPVSPAPGQAVVVGPPGDDGADGDTIVDITLSGDGSALVFHVQRVSGVDLENVNIPALGDLTGAVGDAEDARDEALVYRNAAGGFASAASGSATAANGSAVAAAASAAEAAGYVGGVADGAISTAKIVDGAVTSAKIADGTIVAADLATGAVTSAKILDGTIVDADINASAAIDGSKLAAGSVGTTQLAGTSVTLAKLASSSVDSSKIVDGTIVAGDLASDAVTTAKILNANVTLAKLATGSVDSSKIVDGSVAAGDLASGAVTTTKILDANVTLAKLATGSVDSSKIVDGSIALGDVATAVKTEGLNYDHTAGARAAGLGDLGAEGFVVPYAVTFTSFLVKLGTADASGNTVATLHKNGVAVSGAVVTITAPAITTAAATGSWAFAAGDVLTVSITVGTTPGNKLKAVLAGVKS